MLTRDSNFAKKTINSTFAMLLTISVAVGYCERISKKEQKDKHRHQNGVVLRHGITSTFKWQFMTESA